MAYEIPGFTFSLVAAADLSASQFRACTVDGTGKAALPTAAGRIAGVIQNKPKTNQAVTIVHNGITIAEAGAAITVGAVLEVGADGRFITRTAGVAAGVALETASAAGVKIAVLLNGQLV